MTTAVIDQEKLNAVLDRALNDLSAGYGGVMVSLGHRLGLYRALDGAGPITPAELARRAGCAERYVREWLKGQAAGGYVLYHATSGTFELTPEQALVLADASSPVFMPEAWNVPASMWLDEDKAIDAFRTGAGIAWGDHHARLHHGVATFYRNTYRHNLVPVWLPALDGVVDRLRTGIRVADVGCGHGYSTITLAEAFPNSTFHGLDTHPESIQEARWLAERADVSDRVTFSLAGADNYPGDEYGLICFFDSFHDLGDPLAAARHAARSLADDGTVMLVEPFASDRLEDNLSPVARLYYAVSTTVCCANALADGGRLVLGAQAGPAALRQVFLKGGFTDVREAAATPFNIVMEAKL